MGKADLKNKKDAPETSFFDHLADKSKPKIQEENPLDKIISSNLEFDSPMSDPDL